MSSDFWMVFLAAETVLPVSTRDLMIFASSGGIRVVLIYPMFKFILLLTLVVIRLQRRATSVQQKHFRCGLLTSPPRSTARREWGCREDRCADGQERCRCGP